MHNFDIEDFKYIYTFEEQKKYLEKSNNINYSQILMSNYLSEEFMNKYDDKLDLFGENIKINLSNEFLVERLKSSHWEYNITKFQVLSEEFMEKYKKYINEKNILRYQNLSESLLEKIINEGNSSIIFKYQNLSKEFIEKYYSMYKNNIREIYKYQELSEEFIEKHLLNNLTEIYKYQVFSEEFIKKHLFNKLGKKKLLKKYENEYRDLDLYNIIEHQELSEEFMEKNMMNLDKYLWNKILKHQKLSEKIGIKLLGKIRLSDMVKYIQFSEDFFRTHKDMIYGSLIENIIKHQNKVSEKFKDELKSSSNYEMYGSGYLDLIECGKLSKDEAMKHIDYIGYNNLIKYIKVDEKFIKKNLNKINIKDVFVYQTLSEGFVEKHINKDNIEVVLKHQKLSEEFLEKLTKLSFFDKINNKKLYKEWCLISKYQALSDKFVVKHKKELNWMELSNNQNIDVEILRYGNNRIIIKNFEYEYKDEYKDENNTDFYIKDKIKLKKERIKRYIRIYKIFHNTKNESYKKFTNLEEFKEMIKMMNNSNIDLLDSKYINMEDEKIMEIVEENISLSKKKEKFNKNGKILSYSNETKKLSSKKYSKDKDIIVDEESSLIL